MLHDFFHWLGGQPQWVRTAAFLVGIWIVYGATKLLEALTDKIDDSGLGGRVQRGGQHVGYGLGTLIVWIIKIPVLIIAAPFRLLALFGRAFVGGWREAGKERAEPTGADETASLP